MIKIMKKYDSDKKIAIQQLIANHGQDENFWENELKTIKEKQDRINAKLKAKNLETQSLYNRCATTEEVNEILKEEMPDLNFVNGNQ